MSAGERMRAIETAFRNQANACAAIGSPIYAELLARCADDLAAGGEVARLVEDWQGHPALDNVALRLLGASHYLALLGDAPDFAARLGRPSR